MIVDCPLDPTVARCAEQPGDEGSTKPSRVLLVTPLWGRDGGVAAHVKASAALLNQRGLEVHVLVARIEPGARVSGVKLHQRPDIFDVRAPIEARLGDAMSLHPDVIHLHRRTDPEIVEVMRRSAPVVFSAHGYPACTAGVYYFAPGQECTRSHGPGCVVNLTLRGCAHTRHLKPFPQRYRRTTLGLEGLRHADLVLAYSSSVDRHLATNGLMRRRIIPLFTTMTAKSGSGHAARRRVVFAGRIAGAKGLAVLIRAAQSVEAEFVVCGDGPQEDAMRKLARRLGVEKKFRFKGWLEAEEIADELANASAVVMPSLWPEPFGLVGIEALAAGRPVVASATGGIVDWLEDGVTGLSVQPGDARALARALNELLADPDRQRTMGDAGRKLVAARFSPEHHVAALLESYSAACSTWRAERGVVPG